jgi:hypothetical protein
LPKGKNSQKEKFLLFLYLNAEKINSKFQMDGKVPVKKNGKYNC